MKIILSRKGFDSANGGIVSPIMEDGTLVSFPIPSKDKDLLEHTISLAIEHGKKYVWLGVWEHNERAKRFYEKNGFYRIGAHSFVVGDDVQTDYVMRKDL